MLKIYGTHDDIPGAVEKLKKFGEAKEGADLADLGISIAALKDDPRLAQWLGVTDPAEVNRAAAKLSRDLAMVNLAQAKMHLPSDGTLLTPADPGNPIDLQHKLREAIDSLAKAHQLYPADDADAVVIKKLIFEGRSKG